MTWLDDIPRENDKKTTWWSRRSLLEIKLIILIFLLLLIAAVLVVITACKAHHLPHSDAVEPMPCMKAECIDAASQLLRVRNTTVDPCDDFYEYACGHWDEEYTLPNHANEYSAWTQLRTELAVKLKHVLENSILSDEPSASKKAKTYYQSCMDTEKIEAEGAAPVLRLAHKLGGWPIVNAHWNLSRLDLSLAMSRIVELGLTPAFISPLPMKYEGRFVVAVSPAVQPLKRYVYIEEKYKHDMEAYRRYAFDVMVALGASPDTVSEDVKDMIDFEVKVAGLKYPEGKPFYRYTTTTADLTKSIPMMDWGKYINNVYSVVGISVNSTEKILLEYLDYFKQIGYLIYSSPTRTVVNYMIWTAVHNRLKLLSHPFKNAYSTLNKEFGEVTTQPEQWRQCIETVKYDMAVACSRIFVEDYFDESAKSDTEQMVAILHQTFSRMLDDASWMGVDMKRKAKEKAEAMVDNIGYPHWIINNTILDSYYEKTHVDRDQYFDNVVHFALNVRREILSLVSTQDSAKSITWVSSPVTINAFYYRETNRIEFPAAMLQPPFYHKNYPKSINYGRIGYLIGHEITHGFDNSGRMYNKDGDRANWWTACSVEKFQQRAQCMVEQYDNYMSPQLGTPVNGTVTLGENIADNGGLKQAFQAYQTWRHTSGKTELSLPGVHLDSNQLFFIGFAQLWCLKGTKYFYETMAKDVHSPERFRVIGTLSNSEDFAKAYKCPLGSPMNPVKKCAVW